MCGFAEGALSDIEFAAGEAIANAVEHGHKAASAFTLRCKFVDDCLTIEIEDNGPGFATWKQSRERAEQRHQELRNDGAPTPVRGFGTLLIYRLMDDVEYEDHGRRVRMRKRLPVVSSQANSEQA